jgi:formiminoglutamase
MSLHQKTLPEIWTGRSSNEKEYWHQVVQCLSTLNIPEGIKGKKVAFLGYAGDEGVIRNHGRPGTFAGPSAIRKMLARKAYHLQDSVTILDMGDIIIQNNDMESAHEMLSKAITGILREKAFPIILGGGHDLAYAHGKSLFHFVKEKGEKLGIINLDAHFDLRPLIGGKGHSGSPFFQLAEEFPHDFNYMCLGIQKAANPKSLCESAKKNHVVWIEAENFSLYNWDQISLILDEFCSKVNKIYLSIDLDGYSSAFAPGVSAPSPMGFSPEIALRVLDWIASSGKLLSVDIVELNPQFDQDNATARLAAECIEFLLRKFI